MRDHAAQGRFAGSVLMVGEEPDPPYERPPLSKDYLAGEKPLARLLIRPEGFWAERGIGLFPDTQVVGIDPARKTVVAQTGERIGYRTLVWAAGGRRGG